MLRKIIIGGLITMLSAGLIYGGIYRTAVRAETGEATREGTGRGEGRNAGQNASLKYDHESERRYENSQAYAGNRGNSGNGQSDEEWGGVGNATHQTATYAGIISDVTNDVLTIRLEDGSEILVENRTWWYAQDAGFSTAAGDPVQVTGFIDDDGKFESSVLLNMRSGVQVEIKGEQGGRPNWAGGGGGGGKQGGIS